MTSHCGAQGGGSFRVACSCGSVVREWDQNPTRSLLERSCHANDRTERSTHIGAIEVLGEKARYSCVQKQGVLAAESITKQRGELIERNWLLTDCEHDFMP